jgi:3'(2'), 5'-bisphosphate nucleotidase
VSQVEADPTESDQSLAERLADDAGAALLALRAGQDVEPGSPQLREAGDRLAHHLIFDALSRSRPSDAVRSEEARDDPAHLEAERVWIIDPLDGTREYAELGAAGWRDDWAVHVALWERSIGLTAGAVSLPARGLVFGTSTVPGLSTVRWGERPIRLAVSRSHPAPIVERIAALGDYEFVPMGSAGVKAMAVITGEVDAYLHDGGQFEWDSAAPVAVARAAGCVATRLDGSPLVYNRPDPWLPDLLVSAPSVASDLARAIAQALTSDD